MVYTDPTGETINVASLTADQRKLLLEGLQSFTGNTYTIDDNAMLQLVTVGNENSPLATALINEWIGDTREFSVVESPTGQNRGINSTGEIQLNFSTFDNADYGAVDPRSFNLGSTFVHESLHASTTLQDNIGGIVSLSFDWTGPVVDIVNQIRAERGLPTRAAYLSKQVRRARHRTFFTNVNPRKPDRWYYVTRQQLQR